VIPGRGYIKRGFETLFLYILFREPN